MPWTKSTAAIAITISVTRRTGFLGGGALASGRTGALSRRPGSCGFVGCPVANRMKRISYSGYRFPPAIIQQAIWLYLRFTLSLRDVEDLLAERGITVSYESIRRWINHFGPAIAADLRQRRPKPHTSWHLDEVYLKIDGRMVYLCTGPVETGPACRNEAHAKAVEEIRLRSRSIDHRRPAVVWRRRPRPRHREAP